jgi:hypothetical protein
VAVPRHFQALWLLALAVLALAQVLHVVEHLEVIPQVAHHDHGHDHDHPEESHPAEPGESPSEHNHLADHSHSPAILESQSFFGKRVSAQIGLAATSVAPEAPVWEIEYPPQLS